MKVKFLFICILALGLFQTVFGQTPIAAQGYLLGPGDVISIKVLGEPDFTVEKATIDEDGKIQIPFAEEGLMTKCKTEKDIRAEVVKIYSKMLRNPQVTVQINERKSRPPATIYGEVRTPQRVELTRQVRLLELLGFSGGVTEKAAGMIQVTRTQIPMCAEEKERETWNQETNFGLNAPSSIYSLASINQAQNESNPVIYPGDIIVVMKAPPVYVIGEVNVIKEILITGNGLTLTEALAQAGGFNREAQKKDITVQRMKPNTREPAYISVNYELIKKGKEKDFILEPNDIVIVNKTKKSVGATILEIITGGAKNAANILPTVIL
ncbi:MAG TPA: polysaccharide biosynthesis/export family protein [Pyrinomonadaceae bacterium]|nr:polysaccharide biosynthesis/export family protein [Pyrinomonadaceae bacterium]